MVASHVSEELERKLEKNPPKLGDDPDCVVSSAEFIVSQVFNLNLNW